MKIRSKNVWLDEVLKPAVIEVEGNVIKNILDYDTEADEDYGEEWILPGFIDIHTHGYADCDSNHPTADRLQMWAKAAPKEGLTSFLATTSTQPYEDNIKALEIIGDFIETEYDGAEILGINMEGNFICHEFKGAQNPKYIVEPDADVLKDYIEASKHHLRTVLYAPERDKNFAFLKYAVKEGVSVSAGHSAATYDEVKNAVAQGLRGITHTGNGMRPFRHRDPGIYGAAMNIDELYAETIADGAHVDFEAVNILGRMKGKDRLVMVTDAGMGKDVPVELSGLTINPETMAMYTPDGILCGSAMPYYQGFRNLIEKARLPFVTAVNASSINPARYLKVDKSKGSIEKGKDADFVIMSKNYDLKQVYCRGAKQF